MRLSRNRPWTVLSLTILAAGTLAAVVGASYIEEAEGEKTSRRPAPDVEPVPPAKGSHVPEVATLLEDLAVDAPRTHKNMLVFPLRFGGKQAPGDWATMDQAAAAGHLTITEKDDAAVPEVLMENTGDRTVFLMSGEIVRGGKQTRIVKKDTVIEARQRVAVAVFCVERSRWAGGKDFEGSANLAPARLRDRINRGAAQGEVWTDVRKAARSIGTASPTESLEEVLNADKVQQEHDAAHKSLGKFSPPETVGIAVADMRTGRVVGLELFGCRALFKHLQAKLIEGYTTDLVVIGAGEAPAAKERVSTKDVAAFIRRALAGTSRYEDTPGSGRGLDLESGALRGKGVALGRHAIHLSIQDVRPEVTPAKPVVD